VPLQIVGAGLGRTGTHSLKVALEELLGGPCYHMVEVFQHPDHMALWIDGLRGRDVDWHALFAGYVATVDWPGCAYWRELAAANPDAYVLLSVRDADSWWASMESTIVPALSGPPIPGDPDGGRGQTMIKDMFSARFTPDWADRNRAIAAYDAHCEAVRSEVPAARLIEWRTGEGWEPICAGLGLPVPAAPFPHENSSGEFVDNIERHMAPGTTAD